MNVFFSFWLKKACCFNKKYITVMYSKSKIIYHQEVVVLKGIPFYLHAVCKTGKKNVHVPSHFWDTKGQWGYILSMK